MITPQEMIPQLKLQHITADDVAGHLEKLQKLAPEKLLKELERQGAKYRRAQEEYERQTSWLRVALVAAQEKLDSPQDVVAAAGVADTYARKLWREAGLPPSKPGAKRRTYW